MRFVSAEPSRGERTELMLSSPAISRPSAFGRTPRLHACSLPTQNWKKTPLSWSGPLSASSRSPPQSRLLVKSAGSGADDITKETSEAPKEVENVSGGSGSSSVGFLSVLCPLLKLFAGGDPSQQRNDILEIATSSLSSLARLPWGSASLVGNDNKKEFTKDHSQLLQLYEFEACPFCRRVREAMTELDLSVEVYPCPKGSLRHRQIVRKIGEKEQFPLLVDPNTGLSMYESGDIVKYLFQEYGHGREPSFGLLESTLFTGWMPTILRAGRGMALWDRARKEAPSAKLELFSYENNLYARLVREALCELELPYVLHNVAKGSTRNKLLVQTSGSKEVPYLVDPNTGAKMGDYKKILSYLFQTYSTGN